MASTYSLKIFELKAIQGRVVQNPTYNKLKIIPLLLLKSPPPYSPKKGIFKLSFTSKYSETPVKHLMQEAIDAT